MGFVQSGVRESWNVNIWTRRISDNKNPECIKLDGTNLEYNIFITVNIWTVKIGLQNSGIFKTV